MALPRIFNPSPINIPPSDEKTYPDGYIHILKVSPQRDGTQKLTLVLRPYNYDSGEQYPGIDRDLEFSIDDVMGEAKQIPLLGQAMGTVVQVGSLLIEKRDLLSKIAMLSQQIPTTYFDEETGDTVTRTQDEIDALQAERDAEKLIKESRLSEVNTALGL